MQLPYHNLRMKHWNPGASMPLILPIHVVCNTSDELLYTNIYENSRNGAPWVSAVPPHGRVAVICGSGPSLSYSLGEVKARVSDGAVLFALNGSARYLNEYGMMADYQVILDARPETAQLVGPAHEHLFASQVSPELFGLVDRPRIWQLEVSGIDHILPDHDEDFCLIGGAASVGNTATCLAYALGYRELHLYGYDSSHRDGKGHAFDQPMNAGDPCAVVDFNGKQYTTSLTMKLQAEKFQETAKALKALGCAVHVHGTGLLPDIYNTPRENLTEQEKYRRLWALPEYRIQSPGEECVDKFREVAKPNGGLIVDFGCGTGRAGVKLSQAGHAVLLVDFADNCRDEDAQALPFMCADLTKPLPCLSAPAEHGFCTDVMEHIPGKDVDTVIRNVMGSVRDAFFNISTVPDNLGALINQDLHLTVKPHKWWESRFSDLGYRVAWQEQTPDASSFLVENK